MAKPSAPEVLSLRELNRALLSRQLLLERTNVTVPIAIERLGALQAQWPPAPYIALWSRLTRFSIAALERALDQRKVVKATLMRGTLHLASARDYSHYAVATPEFRRRNWAAVERAVLRYWGDLSPATRKAAKSWRGIGDHKRIYAAMLRFTRTPRGREAMIEFLAKETKLPVELAKHLLWGFIATYGGVVNVPGSAKWANRDAREVIAARTWLKGMAEPSFEDAVLHAVRRYLAAFGPATIDDISSWTSIRTPPIRDALAALGDDVRIFADERKRTLYDLARAPRPGADVAAPVRFLAKWDSPLLAYTPAERVRILPEAYRKNVIIKNGDVAQTFLVDGFVAGTWETRREKEAAILTLKPFAKLGRGDRATLIDEAERLVRFIYPKAAEHVVRT